MTGPQNPMAAIRAKCLDCAEGQTAEVRLCPITQCALHPFRMGSNPHRKQRELSDEARAALLSRLRQHGAGFPETQEQKTRGGEGEGGAP